MTVGDPPGVSTSSVPLLMPVLQGLEYAVPASHANACPSTAPVGVNTFDGSEMLCRVCIMPSGCSATNAESCPFDTFPARNAFPNGENSSRLVAAGIDADAVPSSPSRCRVPSAPSTGISGVTSSAGGAGDGVPAGVALGGGVSTGDGVGETEGTVFAADPQAESNTAPNAIVAMPLPTAHSRRGFDAAP